MTHDGEKGVLDSQEGERKGLCSVSETESENGDDKGVVL